MNPGSIRSIKNLVVRVQFDQDVPELNELILVDDKAHTPLLVDTIESADTVVCLNIRGVRSLQKSMSVQRTGHSIRNSCRRCAHRPRHRLPLAILIDGKSDG